MTDTVYFTPKTYPDYAGLLRCGLITIREVNHLNGGKWSVLEIQAAADAVRDGFDSWFDWRECVFGGLPE